MTLMLANLRTRQLMGVIVLIALLFVPIVLSGHHHVDSDGACAACAVAHHAPIIGAPALPILGVSVAQADIAPRHLRTAPRRTDHAPGEGRAPPSVLLPAIA